MDLDLLLTELRSEAPTPACGTACGVVLSLAIALCEKAARRTAGGGRGAVISQAGTLARRSTGAAAEVERSYDAALRALALGERRAIGEGVGAALDALVGLARAAADVVQLAVSVGAECDPAVRPDAEAAATLAASVAHIASQLAAVNLLAGRDERARTAAAVAAQAGRLAGSALAP